MRRWWAAIIGGASGARRRVRVALALALVAAPILLVAIAREGGRSPADWFSPEPLEVRVGGSLYAVPRNYLVHVAENTFSRTPEIVVVLRALWPELEPLRHDNAHFWERRQPERQIHIGLLVPPRDGYGSLQGFVQLRGARPEPAGFGLTRYRSGLEEFYVAEGSELRRPDGVPIVLKCPDESEKTRSLFEVERICIVEYPLSDGVGLHYRFFMINLAHWREIDRAVRSLVGGFRRRTEVE
jgi:hypothetical protein